MLRRLRTLVRFSTAALFIIFSVAVLALVLPGEWRVLSVQTGSMKPVLKPGDAVLVKKMPAREYNPGDVITFINPANRTQTITHRIVERTDGIKRSIFMTKGDANRAADSPISENLIVGKQVARLPYMGYAMDFIRTIPGLLVIIWLPALWLIIAETKRLSDYYRSLKPYKLYGRGFNPHDDLLLKE